MTILPLLVKLDLLREYRRLDDTITMRLNRTTAQFRDLDRTGSGGKSSVEDQACDHIWRELVGESIVFLVREHTWDSSQMLCSQLETTNRNS